nr:MAG: nonstructural protein [Microvirus sp.]QJB19701.1 MAG: nonstructural protein [Microvirus sp.]
MELKAFSIRDTKAEVFNTPFFQKTHGEAERSFKQLVNDSQSQPSKFPEDYDLYYVGTYSEETGKFTPTATPQHIVKAVQLVQQSQ